MHIRKQKGLSESLLDRPTRRQGDKERQGTKRRHMLNNSDIWAEQGIWQVKRVLWQSVRPGERCDQVVWSKSNAKGKSDARIETEKKLCDLYALERLTHHLKSKAFSRLIMKSCWAFPSTAFPICNIINSHTEHVDSVHSRLVQLELVHCTVFMALSKSRTQVQWTHYNAR